MVAPAADVSDLDGRTGNFICSWILSFVKKKKSGVLNYIVFT